VRFASLRGSVIFVVMMEALTCEVNSRFGEPQKAGLIQALPFFFIGVKAMTCRLSSCPGTVPR